MICKKLCVTGTFVIVLRKKIDRLEFELRKTEAGAVSLFPKYHSRFHVANAFIRAWKIKIILECKQENTLCPFECDRWLSRHPAIVPMATWRRLAFVNLMTGVGMPYGHFWESCFWNGKVWPVAINIRGWFPTESVECPLVTLLASVPNFQVSFFLPDSPVQPTQRNTRLSRNWVSLSALASTPFIHSERIAHKSNT